MLVIFARQKPSVPGFSFLPRAASARFCWSSLRCLPAAQWRVWAGRAPRILGFASLLPPRAQMSKLRL